MGAKNFRFVILFSLLENFVNVIPVLTKVHFTEMKIGVGEFDFTLVAGCAGFAALDGLNNFFERNRVKILVETDPQSLDQTGKRLALDSR